MWLRLAIFFLFVNASVFASTFPVYFVTGVPYGGTSSGSTFGTFVNSSTEMFITYNFLPSGWAWINHPFDVNWTVVNLKNYKRLLLDIKSDTGKVDLFLIDDSTVNGVKSKRYHIDDLSATQYKTIEINLDSFQGIDMTRVKQIQYNPVDASSGVLHQISVRNIFFDQTDVTSTFNTLLIDRLVASGNLSAGAYPSMANYRREIQHLWKGYKYQFVEKYQGVVSSSAYGLIFDPGKGSSSQQDALDYATSEASGYGLLIAIFMNDQPFFDQLLNKTWTIMATSGATNLLAWKVSANGTVADPHSATDADGDVATALMFADILVQKGFWTNTGYSYSTKAQTLIHQYIKNDLEFSRYIRLGDYYNGGRLLTNSSYFSPAWYKNYLLYENQNHDWNPVIAQGYSTISSNPGYSKGLVPDWSNSWGEQSGGNGYTMAWDAIRTYWRLATDKIWFNEPKAQAFLTNASNYIGANKTLASIKFMDLNGNDLYGPNLPLIAMMGAGALGSGDGNYISNWKTVFDGYLNYSYSEKYSFLAVDYDTAGKYDYFGQSLGLLSALLITGAMPNVLTDLVNPGVAPSYVSGAVSTRLHNKSINHVALRLNSTAGGSYISTVDIAQVYSGTGGGAVQFSLPKALWPSLSIVNNPNQAIKDASWEYSVTGSVMSITLSYVISCNWGTGNVATNWNAIDAKKNTYGSWQTDLGNTSIFYPYSGDYLSQLTLNISMGNVSSSARFVYFTVTNAIQMSAADPSWNIRAFSDQVVSESGSAGLARKDASGNILQVLPVKMLLTTNVISFPSSPNAAWLDIYDRQDTTSSVLLRGQNPVALGAYHLGLVVDKQSARTGYYGAILYLELNQGSTTKIDNFEFPDSRLLSEFSTDWGALSQNSGTLANISRQSQGLLDSHVLSFSYTLGVLSGVVGPQAMAYIDLRQHHQLMDLSSYKGLRFWIKTQTNAPIGVVIAATSSVVTDYDDFLYPIHPLPNQWICYTLYFSQFRQAGWGLPAQLSLALANAMTIQFKSLSDRTDEQQTILLDEIELF